VGRAELGSFVLLALVLALGIYLRFSQLSSVPGWASDEGSNIDIAANLARGELQYLAIGRSSFINGHPHFFYLVLAGLFRLAGVELLWARGLTAFYGVLTTVLIYLVGRQIVGRSIALLAAFLFAIYPSAVLFNRMAFSYNQLQPLYLLVFFFLYRFLLAKERKWLFLASLCVTAALVTDLTATSLLFVLLLLVFTVSPQQTLWVLPLSLSLPAIWGLAMWRAGGQAFLDDLAFTMSRVGGNPIEQFVRIVLLYPAALEDDVWLFAGGLGLFLIPDRRSRALALALFFGSLILTVRAGAASGIASYLLIPLLPLVAIGMATLLSRAVPFILREFENLYDSALLGETWCRKWVIVWRPLRPLVVGLTVFIIALTPLVAMVVEGSILDYRETAARLAGTLADPKDAAQIGELLNTTASVDSVVLASPSILWLLDSHTADFQQAIAFTGTKTQHYPAEIHRDRFLFDCSLENADYVVLDPLWRGWASRMMPEVAEMVFEVETWPLQSRIGAFELYRNPSRAE
jgi:4-amino-4-deoxy-L-arabinose transferase-like glycosyltransferase